MLQVFLDHGMLDIGEDDEKFNYLRNTAEDIVQQLNARPYDAIPYTLIALDPKVAPDEPVLETVEAALKQHWNTFRNRFPDRPRQILRAVMLEALQLAGAENPVLAGIIWLTGGNIFPYVELGRERDVCEQLLMQMGEMMETEATKVWSMTHEYHSLALPEFQLDLSKLKAPGLDETYLNSHLAAAVGPSAQQLDISSLTPNPYWPNQGNPWSYEFAPRAASAIAKVVNTAQAGLAKQISALLGQLPEQIAENLSSIDDVMREAVEQAISGAAANERRTTLLWWKQTLYSATLRRGYRALEIAPAAVLMAYDLHKQVPRFCPEGVEYLLREAVRDVIETRDASKSGETTLLQWCDQLCSEAESTILQEALGSVGEVSGRVPLLHAVRLSLAGRSMTGEELTERFGVNSKSAIPPGEFAVWIFRDLQAERLATEAGV